MKPNLIIISNIEWKFLKQRHQYIAEGLLKYYNVIYVESPVKRNPNLKDIPRIISRLIISLKKKKSSTQNIKIITPIVLPSTYNIFRKFNKIFFSKKLSKKIDNFLNSDKDTYILTYLPSETTFDLIQNLKHKLLIYDCVSNFEYVQGMPKDILKTEKNY